MIERIKSPATCTVHLLVIRLSLNTIQLVYQVRAYPGFSNLKQLGVFLLPTGWDVSPLQGYPQH